MHLFAYTELLDLPRHDGAVRFLKAWNFWSDLLQIVLLWLVSSFIVLLGMKSLLDIDVAGNSLLSSLVLLGTLIYASVRTYREVQMGPLSSVLATVGLLAGAAYYFYTKTGDVQGWPLAGHLLAGMGIGLVSTIGVAFLDLAYLLCNVVRNGINWLPSVLAQWMFNLSFPAWKGVACLGPGGYQQLVPARLKQPRAFVASKKLRRNGMAGVSGKVPLFTWQEIQTEGPVRRAMQQWIDAGQHDAAMSPSDIGLGGAALGAAAGAGIAFASFDNADLDNLPLLINPANGLPMMGGIAGVDVQGNSFAMNNMGSMDGSPDHGM